MAQRIEVLAHDQDGRAKTLEKTLAAKGKSAQARIYEQPWQSRYKKNKRPSG
jgi:hypothetical protein